MSSPRTISFRIAPEKVAELDLIAKAMDRDRSYLLNQAVEGYIVEQKRFADLIKEGLDASQRGETIDDEEVDALVKSWIREEVPVEKKVRARA